ncbi:hypothetical protein J6590_044118, partial [Homalodisca vitripennis]
STIFCVSSAFKSAEESNKLIKSIARKVLIRLNVQGRCGQLKKVTDHMVTTVVGDRLVKRAFQQKRIKISLITVQFTWTRLAWAVEMVSPPGRAEPHTYWRSTHLAYLPHIHVQCVPRNVSCQGVNISSLSEWDIDTVSARVPGDFWEKPSIPATPARANVSSSRRRITLASVRRKRESPRERRWRLINIEGNGIFQDIQSAFVDQPPTTDQRPIASGDHHSRIKMVATKRKGTRMRSELMNDGKCPENHVSFTISFHRQKQTSNKVIDINRRTTTGSNTLELGASVETQLMPTCDAHFARGLAQANLGQTDGHHVGWSCRIHTATYRQGRAGAALKKYGTLRAGQQPCFSSPGPRVETSRVLHGEISFHFRGVQRIESCFSYRTVVAVRRDEDVTTTQVDVTLGWPTSRRLTFNVTERQDVFVTWRTVVTCNVCANRMNSSYTSSLLNNR